MSTTTDLLSIYDIPFVSLLVAVQNVSGFEVAITVPRIGIRFGIVEVFVDNRRPSHAEFSSHVVSCYIVAFIVNQSDPCQSTIFPYRLETTHLTSVLGMNVFPTLPVSSSSG